MQAFYSGDNIYSAATSQVVNEVVQQSSTTPTTTALTVSASQITIGLDATGQAALTTSSLSLGNHSLRAA